MIKKKRKKSIKTIKRSKRSKRKSINLSEVNLVKTSSLTPGETLPLVVQPAVESPNLVEWTSNNLEFINSKLLKHGGLLLRGFNVTSVPEFERFADAACPKLFGDYGDLPREEMGGKVYSSTPYPNDETILFHNESSHMNQWPLKQFFYCVTAAQEGGETPIIDCRKAYQLLDPEVCQKFEEKGLMYVRNFTGKLDVTWEEFFHTEDRAVVEEYCRPANIECEWKEDGTLKTKQVRPAVIKHPLSGEMLFFNQIPIHHISCLKPSVRDSLLSLFGEDNLPRNVYYGDGTPIEDEVVQDIIDLYYRIAVSFPWQEGDILMVDNMLTSHSRNPFKGPRKIVVAMGEMIHHKDLQNGH